MDDAGVYCVITGSAGGIGRALVKSFTDAGYCVIGLDRSQKPDDIDCLHWIQCDLGELAKNAENASDVIERISAIVGEANLHVLINNAAEQILGGVESLTREDWRKTLDVNLMAPFFLAQGLLRMLEKAGGSIINIGSIHSKLTKKNFVAYATSKAALAGMTRSMAVDIGCKIRVNAIEPAAIDTQMLIDGFGGSAEKLELLKSCHPTSNIGRPEEVAQIATMLARRDFGFLNGSIISVDGGISSALKDPS